jgi:predicted DNA-binding protein
MIKLKRLLLEVQESEIISNLKRYRGEYSAEGKSDFVKDIDLILKYIKEGDLQSAFNIFAKSDMKYDIGTTYTNLQRLKDDKYVESNFDKNWAAHPGTYEAFRAGPIANTKNGIFFSIDRNGAEEYSNSGSREVKKYNVTINKPLVARIHVDALSKLTGKPNAYFIKQKDNSKNVQKWWLNTDAMIRTLALKSGYDSILYTHPAPPAIRGDANRPP